VVIACGDLLAVAFNVPVAEFYTARALERSAAIPKLGTDVLGEGFTLESGVKALWEYGAANPEAEVGNVLLNQRVMAGLGNVYKSEVAFAAGVHPFRAMRTVTERERETMVEFAMRLMKANVAAGASTGIVTYTGHRRTTGAMQQGDRLWVYKRARQECRRCGAVIETRKQGTGARVTFWCPECQPWRE
jgi:endonuclease-8